MKKREMMQAVRAKAKLHARRDRILAALRSRPQQANAGERAAVRGLLSQLLDAVVWPPEARSSERVECLLETYTNAIVAAAQPVNDPHQETP